MSKELVLTRAALEAGEVVPVDKPAGWTSFDVVNKLRRVTTVKKVGHAGTLDPFATGLLLICFGKATKQSASLMGQPKIYEARLQLGVETDAHDLTGQVVSTAQVGPIDATRIEPVLEAFRGEIEQVPPMFSALKKGGTRLYKLARAGKTVAREPRKVTIHELTLLEHGAEWLRVRIACTTGTYVRALARDIGRKLGCGAHLTALSRLSIGAYSLSDAWQVDEFVTAFTRQNTAYGRS